MEGVVVSARRDGANFTVSVVSSGFVQWAPSGLRSTLAYPTPIQTAKSLSETLQTRRFRRLCKKMGRDEVLAELMEEHVALKKSLGEI